MSPELTCAIGLVIGFYFGVVLMALLQVERTMTGGKR